MEHLNYAAPVPPGIIVLTIRPLPDGWAVQCPGIENLLVYRAGSAAEHAARRIAERLSGAGRWVEIHILLRSGAFGARLVCPPSAPSLTEWFEPPDTWTSSPTRSDADGLQMSA